MSGRPRPQTFTVTGTVPGISVPAKRAYGSPVHSPRTRTSRSGAVRFIRDFREVDAYFTTDANTQLPATIAVSYWNGLAWVPVTAQHVSFATGSDQPTKITFDPISTAKVKLDMTSASPNSPVTGNLTIGDLAIPGAVVAYNTAAELSSLEINGRRIPGFDPAAHVYRFSVRTRPRIAATAAENGRALIVPPLSIPGTATVTVTSEDGQHQSTYTIELVGLTAPGLSAWN
jgi:hypothetical protein